MRGLFGLLFLVLFNQACSTWQQAARAGITANEQSRLRAMVANDIPTLSKLVANDLVFTHSNGARENKAEFIEAVQTGKYRFNAYTIDSIDWRMHKQRVVTYGSAYIDVEVREKQYKLLTRYTATYTPHKKHGWQLSSWQNTKVADAPK
jgi:hypothetical protein